MNLLIATQSYSYFKRQWWQLTSIVKQIPFNDVFPKITYRLNIFKGDPNIDLAKRMIDVFSSLVSLDVVEWDNADEFAYRSVVRSKDLSVLDRYDAILYVDPDIVFHQELLSRLQYFYSDCKSLVACRRKQIFNADSLILSESYTVPIEDIYKKIGDNGSSPQKSRLGAGFFQYVTSNLLKSKNISTYASKICDRSIFDSKNFATRSEQHFRKKVGSKIFGRYLTRIWHLEHERHVEFECR